MTRKSPNNLMEERTEINEVEDSLVSADEKPKRSDASRVGRVVNTRYARLRKTPAANAQVVKSMKFGEKGEIIGEITGFYKIRTFEESLTGYISSNYFEEE